MRDFLNWVQMLLPSISAEFGDSVLLEKYLRGIEASLHKVRACVARALSDGIDAQDRSHFHVLNEFLRETKSVSPKPWTRLATILNLLRKLQLKKRPKSAPIDEARSKINSHPPYSLRPPVRAPPWGWFVASLAR